MSSQLYCHTSSNKQPVLLPHFYIPRTVASSATTPLLTSSHFYYHTFVSSEQEVISAITSLYFVPEATLPVAQDLTIDQLCKFITDLLTSKLFAIFVTSKWFSNRKQFSCF